MPTLWKAGRVRVRRSPAAVSLLRPHISAFGWSNLICERCERVRTRIEAGAMSRFSLADRRGRTGPPTIGDDELLVTFTRRLRDADLCRAVLDEKDARQAKTRSWYKDTKRGLGAKISRTDPRVRRTTLGTILRSQRLRRHERGEARCRLGADRRNLTDGKRRPGKERRHRLAGLPFPDHARRGAGTVEPRGLEML